MTGKEIIDFEPRFAPAFFALNEAWTSALFAMEPKDREILSDPQGLIINKGGAILFAAENGVAVGCCALIAMDDGVFEIVKMAVADACKGRGIGRDLMAACVDRARASGALRLYLESNSALTPALTLYRSFGFVDLPPERRPVSTYA